MREPKKKSTKVMTWCPGGGKPAHKKGSPHYDDEKPFKVRCPHCNKQLLTSKYACCGGFCDCWHHSVPKHKSMVRKEDLCEYEVKEAS